MAEVHMDSLREDRSRITDAIAAVHAQTCYRRRAPKDGMVASARLVGRAITPDPLGEVSGH
jgi:hypothetical protein